MEVVLKYIGIISSSTIMAFLLIKYFSQKVFESYLQKSTETHKSNLEKINIFHEIQFTALHKERANVIKELYYKLYDYKMAIIFFFNVPLSKINPGDDLKQRLALWNNGTLNFSGYFHRNRIYFKKNLCKIIDELNNELDKINKDTNDFLKSFELMEGQISSIRNDDKKFIELKNRTNKFIDDNIEFITNQLEAEFRRILGVEMD